MAEGHGWVVRPAQIPTTPRRPAPALPLLTQGGEFFSYLCRRV
jgi:hypothetical protein